MLIIFRGDLQNYLTAFVDKTESWLIDIYNGRAEHPLSLVSEKTVGIFWK